MALHTIAPTLSSRLASACVCSYGISAKTGHYTPPAIYDAAVNWIGTPKPVAAPSIPGGPLINACLIGLNQDGIILAFRGTLPPAWTVASLEDWWQDIVGSEPIHASPLPGKVHSGFWKALSTLWNEVLHELKNLRNAHPQALIYITGHSKGGPLASLGGARLLLEDKIRAERIITFASPHPGDKKFVSDYPRQLPVTRFENYLDIVPFIPPTKTFFDAFQHIEDTWFGKLFCQWFPSVCKALDNASKWDYEALGVLEYVTASGKVVGAGDPLADPYFRLGEILWVLFGIGGEFKALEDLVAQEPIADNPSGLSRIGAAHCISCKSDKPLCAGGYMIGAGGDSICPASGAN